MLLHKTIFKNSDNPHSYFSATTEAQVNFLNSSHIGIKQKRNEPQPNILPSSSFILHSRFDINRSPCRDNPASE